MRTTRRKRNRKKRMEGYLLPVPFTSLLVVAGALALAYLWILSRSEVIGAEIKSLERREAELTETFLNEEMKWNRLRSPQNLERILSRNGIRMGWPSREQVVVLAHAGIWEPEERESAPVADARYAGVGRMTSYE